MRIITVASPCDRIGAAQLAANISVAFAMSGLKSVVYDLNSSPDDLPEYQNPNVAAKTLLEWNAARKKTTSTSVGAFGHLENISVVQPLIGESEPEIPPADLMVFCVTGASAAEFKDAILESDMIVVPVPATKAGLTAFCKSASVLISDLQKDERFSIDDLEFVYTTANPAEYKPTDEEWDKFEEDFGNHEVYWLPPLKKNNAYHVAFTRGLGVLELPQATGVLSAQNDFLSFATQVQSLLGVGSSPKASAGMSM